MNPESTPGAGARLEMATDGASHLHRGESSLDPSSQVAAEVGMRVGYVIRRLADRRRRNTGDVDVILATVEQVMTEMPIRMAPAAARQRLAVSAGLYVRQLLPTGWRCLGIELELTDGRRVDLGWRAPDGRVLFDELKSGATDAAKALSDPLVADAVAAYGEAGRRRFGPRFIGVRLISLKVPSTSLLITEASIERLTASPYWFGAAR